MQTKTVASVTKYRGRPSSRAAWPPPALKESLDVVRAAPQRWQAPRAWCPTG